MELIETKLDSWSKIFELNRYFLSPFVFRGQNNYEWPLTTSIERSITSFSKFKVGLRFGYETEEKWMLHEFKKKYPLFSSILPKQVDNFEWLAIMQHHGAPTRLLDFTESIFISSYFSVIESNTDSIIWCINRHQLRDFLHERFELSYEPRKQLKDEINDIHIDLANKIIAKKGAGLEKNKISSIIPLEPNIHTERLSRQQGLFLMPTNSGNSFFNNLIGAFKLTDSQFRLEEFDNLVKRSNTMLLDHNIYIIKIILPKNIHYDVYHSLKDMNITAESLFPGVDGLAKSLFHSHILT